MTAISRQSQQCNVFTCRIEGRQPGVQKKNLHTIYKTLSLVNCMAGSGLLTVQPICVRSC